MIILQQKFGSGGGKFTPLGENLAKNQQNVQKVETNYCFFVIQIWVGG